MFFPVSSLNPVISLIINISPLTWINRGIVACIYDNNLQLLFNISCIFVVVSIFMTILTIKFLKGGLYIVNVINVFNINLKRNINKRIVFLVTLLFPIIIVILGVLANYISKPFLILVF